MLRNARTRLIIASALLSGGVAAVILVFVYLTVNSIIETETRSVVEAELAGLQSDYNRLGTLGLAAAIEERVESSIQRDAIYLLADARGRAITGNLAAWPPTVEPGGGWVELTLIRTDSEQSVPVAAASLRLPGGERLLVGRDASAQRRFDAALTQSAIWGAVGAIALSLITGWLLTRLIFSRIADISRTADSIVTGDIERRVPLRGTGDELDQLSETLNEMLDRISDLILNLRMTTSSFSHDLRSPLTRLRANLEDLANQTDGSPEQKSLAEKSLLEADRLLTIFDNLVEIARAEAKVSRDDFEDLDLGSIVLDAVDLYSPVAEERQIRIVARAGEQVLPGHRQLLMLALSNLIENALKYAPNDSTVEVSLERKEEHVELSVSDQGPGLPEGFIHEALQPFKTADPSRTDGGTGLGLALVAAVARLHDGMVHLENCEPGLRVTLRLPVQ